MILPHLPKDNCRIPAPPGRARKQISPSDSHVFCFFSSTSTSQSIQRQHLATPFRPRTNDAQRPAIQQDNISTTMKLSIQFIYLAATLFAGHAFAVPAADADASLERRSCSHECGDPDEGGANCECRGWHCTKGWCNHHPFAE
ncbi:unnamed protein product [Zymoseptoria tritici ST99CH_3D7]|uniref:Uncharacterized protein n=1 Tax=Zymoseptoria tritici (strain ST99CH_3D7) TaxID=1276538 RepID=A0A1X7RZ29_ZYMT9|nr:unnamed protein product [Zymoseptoria tritici ST99CH_3D7]